MAFSTFIRTLELKPRLLLDCIELPISHDDSRFRQFYDGAYMDYYGIFSWNEVWELNEKAVAEDSGLSGWLKKNLELKKFLKNSDKSTTLFVINSYEWESGM